jgi:hypothetical protein
VLPDGFIVVLDPLAEPGVVPVALPLPLTVLPLPFPVVPEAALPPPVAPPVPLAPPPVCASANVEAKAMLAANAIVVTFMLLSSLLSLTKVVPINRSFASIFFWSSEGQRTSRRKTVEENQVRIEFYLQETRKQRNELCQRFGAS